MVKINKVLVVGLGSIGKRHLDNIRQLLPHARLAVLRSQQGSAATNNYETLTSLEAAIAFKPDMAMICGPSTFHIEIAERLAVGGVHLFIEKPLSNQIQGLSSFIEMVDRSDLKVMVGYNLRFSPSLIAFKSLLDSEEYGRSLVVSAEVGQYLPSWRPDVDYRDTVSAKAKLGGGALLELSHELDYLIWLFGRAVTASAKLAKVSDLEMNVEDLVLAHIGFNKNGHSICSSVQLDFLQRQPYRQCKVVCEHGTLVWNAISGSVELFQQNGSNIIFQDDSDSNFTYEKELKTFIDCVESGSAVPISIQDGLNVLEVVEAIRKSSELDVMVRV